MLLRQPQTTISHSFSPPSKSPQAAQFSWYQDAAPVISNGVSGVNVSPGVCLASPPLAGVVDYTKNAGATPPTVVWPPGAAEKMVCYSWGWTPEVSPAPKVAALGGPAAKTTKWYTLGRLSHEVSGERVTGAPINVMLPRARSRGRHVCVCRGGGSYT